jgi:hypothetical protein
MTRRVIELEKQISRAGAAASSTAANSPAATRPMHIASSLSSPLVVLQDSRNFSHQQHSISRGIAHKNRVFGPSHWMNGFVLFKDVIEILEPVLRSGGSNLPSSMHRTKVLARAIKSQRSPDWPTPATNDLPLRDVCDELVEHYLRTMETLYRVLHVPTFRKEYNALWSSGTEPKPAFMVQLKLILAIGTIFYDQNCSMRAEATRWIYEAQTWLSSPKLKSRLGIQQLQTSILLLLTREMVDVGSELVWISAGSLLREAIYIGMHKDPAQLPRLGVFESEMRRRLWNTILEINLQFSLISGGPCLVSLEDFNTKPPGNFNDEQLTASEPHAMPDHVYTQSSLAIALRKTLPVRLAVVRFLNDVATTGTYEETLRIDKAVRDSYKDLRRTLQGYSADNAKPPPFATDAIDFIMHRYISSLHIPYFNASLHEAAYAFSRKAVVDTSLKIWNLACPAAPEITAEPYIARLCRCGAGFFRGFAFHASSFLVVELRTQLQEEDSVPRPDLLPLPQDAANMVLRTIEAGETGIKGYLLMRILAAQIEGIKQRLGKIEMTSLLCDAAEEAVGRCVALLERIAGQETGETFLENGVGEFDFQVSGNFLEKWDLMMEDMFNFGTGGGGGMDAFMS